MRLWLLMTGLWSGLDLEGSASKPSPQHTVLHAPCGGGGGRIIKAAWTGTPNSPLALSDMSDKQDSTVTRPGGDEGSFVIPDNRHMVGIFISPPSPSSLALGLPCQCGAKYPITTSLRTEPEKQPSHLTLAVLAPHWGSRTGFRCRRQGLCGFLLAAPRAGPSICNTARQEDCPSPHPPASSLPQVKRPGDDSREPGSPPRRAGIVL